MSAFNSMPRSGTKGRGMLAIGLLLQALILTGITFAGLAIWSQPRVADDWHLAWGLAQAGSWWRFVGEMYQTSGGRIVTYTLDGLTVSSESGARIFKLLTIPCFLLFSACACYLANVSRSRHGASDYGPWLVVAAILWLGLPVVSDTIVQLTGACAYLWPATLGLVLLCCFRRMYKRALESKVGAGGAGPQFAWLIAGTIVGTCNEQLFAGMTVVLGGWGWILWREKRLDNLPTEVWWGIAGLILGTSILVAAPGNYLRLDAEGWQSGGLGGILLRFGMYLGGAYFALGTGDQGRTLWMGMALVAMSGVFTVQGNRGKESCIWIAGSLATLAPMLPLVNIASPRTTFLAATFLLIAVMTAFPRTATQEDSPSATSLLVAYAIAMLVAIDGFVGWTANRSVAKESAAREKIIQIAAAEGRKEVAVPYLATVPSRLTYMLNPEHDSQFISKLAAYYGVGRAYHDVSPDAPRPFTLNSLKALKNSL